MMLLWKTLVCLETCTQQMKLKSLLVKLAARVADKLTWTL